MTTQEARAAANMVGNQLQHEWMVTHRVLGAIPEAQKHHKHEEKGRSAWDLAVHLAQTDVWFLESVLEGAFNKPRNRTPQTVSELADWYKTTMPAKLEQVLALPDEKLTETMDFYGMKNPAVSYVMFCLVHMVHHRGQLVTYLRPMGSKVPSIYGGSADESFPAQQ